MKISCRTIRQGDYLPPWYYGVAYLSPFDMTRVFYPIPLNYCVRIWRFLCYHWDRLRSRITVVRLTASELQAYRDTEFMRGKLFGYSEGYKEGMQAVIHKAKAREQT